MLSKADSLKLVEAQVTISKALDGINANLSKMNDQNVLHATAHQIQIDNSNRIIETLKTMTDKYWWLIIALIVALLAVLGYKEALKFIGV